MRGILVCVILALVLGAGCASDNGSVPISNEGRAVQGSTSSTLPRPQSSMNAATLDLSGKGLTSIPSDVFSRTGLERLDLSNNELTGAPQAEIRHLQKLNYLNLSGNRLTGLPAELGQLKYLRELNVSNNRLTGLPLELGDLTELRVLDISGNPYSEQDLDRIAEKLTKTIIRK